MKTIILKIYNEDDYNFDLWLLNIRFYVQFCVDTFRTRASRYSSRIVSSV